MKQVITTYKAFDSNLQCRGFQFEVGQTYKIEGEVKACSSGFHACENPMHMFAYYRPATNPRFAQVSQSGALSRHDEDTKIASASITISAEVKLPEIIVMAVRWITEKAKELAKAVDGVRSSSAANGVRSSSAANGDYSSSAANGSQSVAMSAGRDGKVKGVDGCALFLVKRDDAGEITHTWSGIVGKKNIKAEVWYTLATNGKPVMAES